ncbi:MAG TPA: class I SAM-dependent methyltransferase [Firmicutes bacterium]|nr:class I SAM-dependent methyltransferase [Bacillota bacterium]
MTLSEEQYKEFRRRIEAEHLEDLLTVELMDYRDLPKYGKTFDRVVSVGMVEHVGRDNYRLFMDCVKEMLPARRRSTTASSTFIRFCSPKGSTTSCPW